MSDLGRDAFTFIGPWDGRLVATAVHNGHDLREEIAEEIALEEDERFREEDPFTDLIGSGVLSQVVVHRSRFEVDLNRTRDEAVYVDGDDAWGLDLWEHDHLSEEQVERSLKIYDAFYRELGLRLDAIAQDGPFVVFDVHSYNHRREGEDADPDPETENPEVNVGTGSLDRDRFGGVVDAFIDAMSAQGLDARENVKFKGRGLAQWIHRRYPGVACVLALEFKKTYMDEWSGMPSQSRIYALREALTQTIEPTLAALKAIDER